MLSSENRTYHNFCRLILFSLALAYFLPVNGAGSLSEQSRISILTIDPGKPLYTLFGHTALRIYDPVLNIDRVYNYGTFDFDQPHFYWRFLRGNLQYYLTVDDYPLFYAIYTFEERNIREQELILPYETRCRIYDSLQTNLLPEHASYTYDFFRDNCTTRVLDLILALVPDTLYPHFMDNPVPTTFRKELASYMGPSHVWLYLGISILLGKKADEPLTLRQSLFLPVSLMNGLNQLNWVKPIQWIYQAPSPPLPAGAYPLFPTMILWIVAILLIVEAMHPKISLLVSDRIDFTIFMITGLPGILILWFQFFSDHPSVHSNYNLLWANPVNIITALLLINRKYKAARYPLALATLGMVLGIISIQRLPQQIPQEIIPVIAMLTFRSLQRLFRFVEKPLAKPA